MIKNVSMKKVIFFVMMFCCLLTIQNTVSAAQTLSLNYDGKSVKYTGSTYKIAIDKKEVKTDFPGIVYNKVTLLPIRAVFEQLGGKVTWSSKTELMDVTYNGMELQFKNNDAKAKINGKTIKLSAPVKKINDRLLVSIDFLKNLETLNSVIDNKSQLINISTIKPKKITTATPATTTTTATKALSFKYDGKTVKYTGITYKISIDNKEVKTDFPGIVFNKVTMLPIRAVFEQLGGKVTWNSKTELMDVTYNGIKLQFKNNDTKVNINGKTIKMSAPVKNINDRLIVPIDFFKNLQALTLITDDKAKSIVISSSGSVKEISSITSEGKDIVTLKMNNHKGFEVFRLTSPDRIVVDFKNVKSSEELQDIKTNLSMVSGIRFSALDKNSTRVVVDLEGMNNFSVESNNEGCKIIIEKPLNTKLAYENNFDRVYFSLEGIKLTSTSSTVTNYFTEEYDVENNKYTITIPYTSPISLADETFNINDSLVDTVVINRDKETNDTKIVFHTKKEFKFYTSYNDKRNQTEINLLTPAKDDERLVVIDAGHGGQDPGAAKGSVKEKDLNLAIALKLEKLLKAKNIKTFMLRQDDTFVGLYDRPYIANALNATLFFSIHNNAIDSSKTSGTETLYFPEKVGDTSFTGAKFAKLVQDSLISSLKTNNRKTIERPGLVVLKYTKMPACLAEVGFVTNSNELKNLINQAYQQKAAEAMCSAIVKSLEKIEIDKKANTVLELETDANKVIEPETDANTVIEKETDANTIVEPEIDGTDIDL